LAGPMAADVIARADAFGKSRPFLAFDPVHRPPQRIE
jgi:hypothetical protein